MIPTLAARIRTLSPRQIESVAWTFHGLSNREIARAMGCSPETVHGHLQHAYARLGVDREGSDPCGSPRTVAAVALYLALRQATGGSARRAG